MALFISLICKFTHRVIIRDCDMTHCAPAHPSLSVGEEQSEQSSRPWSLPVVRVAKLFYKTVCIALVQAAVTCRALYPITMGSPDHTSIFFGMIDLHSVNVRVFFSVYSCVKHAGDVAHFAGPLLVWC